MAPPFSPARRVQQCGPTGPPQHTHYHPTPPGLTYLHVGCGCAGCSELLRQHVAQSDGICLDAAAQEPAHQGGEEGGGICLPRNLHTRRGASKARFAASPWAFHTFPTQSTCVSPWEFHTALPAQSSCVSPWAFHAFPTQSTCVSPSAAGTACSAVPPLEIPHIPHTIYLCIPLGGGYSVLRCASTSLCCRREAAMREEVSASRRAETEAEAEAVAGALAGAADGLKSALRGGLSSRGRPRARQAEKQRGRHTSPPHTFWAGALPAPPPPPPLWAPGGGGAA